jgi:hypothetical protein
MKLAVPSAPPRLTAEPQSLTADHGQPVVLACAANVPALKCEWFTPYGAVFEPQASDRFYSLVGDVRRGNCTLRIATVHARDEGVWKCKVFLMLPADAVGSTLLSQPAGAVQQQQKQRNKSNRRTRLVPAELESKAAFLRLRQAPPSVNGDESVLSGTCPLLQLGREETRRSDWTFHCTNLSFSLTGHCLDQAQHDALFN